MTNQTAVRFGYPDTLILPITGDVRNPNDVERAFGKAGDGGRVDDLRIKRQRVGSYVRNLLIVQDATKGGHPLGAVDDHFYRLALVIIPGREVAT